MTTPNFFEVFLQLKRNQLECKQCFGSYYFDSVFLKKIYLYFSKIYG